MEKKKKKKTLYQIIDHRHDRSNQKKKIPTVSYWKKLDENIRY